jgi:2-haloacid dehalogenase
MPSVTERWATFDCYGTLVDWESGLHRTYADLWPDADTDSLVRAHHTVEPRVQEGSSAPYRDVLSACLRLVAAEHGLTPSDPDALAASLPRWPAFDEVADALRELRHAGWRLAILSNTDPDLLAASVASIGVEMDVQITAAEARSYKPAHGHWLRFFETTGADRGLHVHVAASLFHDIAPAAELGLRSVWINRLGQSSEIPRAAELPTLAGLAAVLEDLTG